MPEQAGGYTPEIWTYEPPSSRDVPPFGDDVTYRKGLGWLYEDCATVQDWGAGMAYGRRFLPLGKAYLAVDGSPTSEGYADVVCELTEWHPDPLPEGIFMRHVLEHNETGWQGILAHALEAFTRRFCLVIFTPFSTGGTHRLRPPGDPYCDLSFSFDDLMSRLAGFSWRTEGLATNTQYGSETLFYVEAGHADV